MFHTLLHLSVLLMKTLKQFSPICELVLQLHVVVVIIIIIRYYLYIA
jgi:hypothetical protein